MNIGLVSVAYRTTPDQNFIQKYVDKFNIYLTIKTADN